MTASCDTCRAPGNCCRGFVLAIGWLREATWREDAEAQMKRHDLPFVPVRISLRHHGDPGWVVAVFDCPLLGPDGRCTSYETRPHTCHAYQPGEDQLCAEYVPTLKGIPIHTTHATP